MTFAAAMLIGLTIDILLGWPDAIYRRIGHPVTWIGRLISVLEQRLNHGTRARRIAFGGLTTLIVAGLVGTIAWFFQSTLPSEPLGWSLMGVLAWPFIAARSLHEHIAAVARPLAFADIDEARREVAKIVGRDPKSLDEAGIARAAMESLAENASDGVIAPLFWGLVAGLPGIAAYKAINTLDSMIGHRNDRYEAFGKIAARLDDVVNYIPARITALLFAIAAGRGAKAAVATIRQDAHRHRSINAGWPETAMAGALNVRLSGPRIYGDRKTDDPWLNGDADDPGSDALFKGLALYQRAVGLFALCLLGLWLL